MTSTLRTTALLALVLAAASCSSTRYGDPKDTETVNIDWGSTDLQTMTGKMVESLKNSPALAYFDRPNKEADKRVITYMGGIRNETSEHINTGTVSDVIRTDLLQSGRFRFVADKKGQEDIGEQVHFQQESGRFDPTRAMAFGKQIGAEVIVYGTLSSIEKKKGRSLESGGSKFEDTYYLLVLNAVNVETGELMWSDKGEIRKTQRTGLFGGA
jgi:uncharacterized protein (TIGR02722 family)